MSALDVLLASDDRSFLRLAGAILGRDGHTTTRTSVSARRVERLVRLRRPDVLVLDAQDDPVVVAEVCSMVFRSTHPTGLVLVCDEDPGASGELAVVARWGAPEQLLDAVRDAALEPAPVAPAPAGLRLVP